MRCSHSHLSRLILSALGIFVCFVFPLTSKARAVSSSKFFERSKTKTDFPEPPLVREQTRFWNAIFVRFPSTSILIHDSTYPEIIIDLIDLEVFAKKHGNSLLKNRTKRESLVSQYVNRYEQGISRFAKLQSKATKLGAIEQRVYNVYRKNPQALRDLFHGRVNIRSQSGLSDEFKRAAERARELLPYMERIFVDQGIPVELTRLAFVESMFNTAAISKVGASGIWQFMPGTAKLFMRVDTYIDERNSPIKASKAAARLLHSNYKSLGTWPLAITAYNHGPASLSRAIRTLGTKDFETILKKNRSNSFGFASRNFYAEFLSAKNVYQSIFAHKHANPRSLSLASVKLSKPVSIAYLNRKTSLSKDLLTLHNPCILKKGFLRYQNEPLPKNFELIVPRHLVKQITNALNEAPTSQRVMRF